MTTCKARDMDPPPVPRACAGDDLTPVPCAFQLGDLQTTWVTTSVSHSRKYNCVVVKGGVDHQPWTLPRLLLLCSRSCPTLGAIPKLHGNTSASGSRLPTLQSRSSLGRDWQSLRVQLCPQPHFCDTIQETSSVVHSAPRLVFAGRKFESVRCTQNGARVPEFTEMLTLKPRVGGGNSLYVSSGPKVRVLGSSSLMDLFTPASLRLQ